MIDEPLSTGEREEMKWNGSFYHLFYTFMNSILIILCVKASSYISLSTNEIRTLVNDIEQTAASQRRWRGEEWRKNWNASWINKMFSPSLHLRISEYVFFCNCFFLLLLLLLLLLSSYCRNQRPHHHLPHKRHYKCAALQPSEAEFLIEIRHFRIIK